MERKYDEIVKYSKENNELTKRALKDALVKLLHTHSFDSISISKLCSVAGVSRMSFYRNYTIIYDIFHEFAVELNVEIINAVGSPFRNGTDIVWYEKTFEMIASKKDEFLLLTQKQFQEEWMRVVNELANHSSDFSNETTYQRLMWCGGFENVASNWVNNGMKESIEEISSYCIKYLPHLVKED
jgi:AcrR family transcriptional regulator